MTHRAFNVLRTWPFTVYGVVVLGLSTLNSVLWQSIAPTIYESGIGSVFFAVSLVLSVAGAPFYLLGEAASTLPQAAATTLALVGGLAAFIVLDLLFSAIRRARLRNRLARAASPGRS